MENASKALLIAGGILIALLIIGLLVYSFGSMSGYFASEEAKEEAEQLEAFNKQYEAYHKKLLRGTEVISVVNKVLDNNKKYENTEPNYMMTVEFEMKEGFVYKKDNTTGTNKKVDNVTFKVGQTYNQNSLIEIKQSTDAFNDFKRRVFDCVDVKYHKTTGRVNYMKFVERKMNNYEIDY